MFYSNALSVRLKLLKIKKNPINSKAPGEKRECSGDTKVLRKKGPDQFEGGGEKKGWPGEEKVPKKFPD